MATLEEREPLGTLVNQEQMAGMEMMVELVQQEEQVSLAGLVLRVALEILAQEVILDHLAALEPPDGMEQMEEMV